jgi:tRNA nucleotidyltransferase (CCA-adding enzyme)
VLTQVIPELKPMVGFDQRSPHHAYDLYTHVAYVVDKMPQDLELRWAALLHDVGKVSCCTLDETGRGHYKGHGPVGASMAGAVLDRFRATTALKNQVVTLIENHMLRLKPDRIGLKQQIHRLGWETVWQCLALQEADMASKGLPNQEELRKYAQVRQILQQLQEEKACVTVKELAVNGRDLMALGIRGREVGEMLNHLLELVLLEQVENTREALLDRIRREEV